MTPTLPDFSRGRVLIVGDVMLDRYWHGATSRISPEAPVPVVKVDMDEFRAGGAGNVALNVATLGGGVSLVGLVGDDESAGLLRARLEAGRVACHFVPVAGSHTITKLRVISRHQQLIRLDFEDGFTRAEAAAVTAAVRAGLDGVGAVVLSDYAKGTLADARALVHAARERGLPIVVDPKGTDFERYRGASVLTPNLSEFEAVVGRCADEASLRARGTALRDTLDLDALLITRSERGMTLLQRGHPPLDLPTHAREVFDVTGAGDTVVALLAAGLAAGLPLAEATALANVGAGVVVGKLGTATVSVDELAAALHAPAGGARGIVDEPRLAAAVAQARDAGERVVLYPAAFDGLRPADLRALQAARRQGDRLVAAVLNDAAATCALGERLALAAALEAVDWTIACDESPAELAARIGAELAVS
ncbi:MAG TPA: bifunctional D-glycero-beta-D-manno-heptose-7-phosphate kinase/D-glycero-beta-D-manno-heptose 1-phosphate adenylyltransferase HldE [Rhodocyclaceae bacterium]|nr:bifunctional D-glycero-beta-D-manno-heptose-7-phosphate kinase/D-glycero-beta-D-manno-heptose 1-phosphate adenylyltransferase HldE [Rhodocyclaceae bacterium]